MEPDRDDVVRAYYRIRQMLGWLGLSLPLVLIIGGVLSKGAVEPSISDYYHTLMRDAFVGVLTAIGLFLIAYPGHDPSRGEHVSDDFITSVAGVCAFGVAYFPNAVHTNANLLGSITQQMLGYKMAAVAHYTCAIVFLSALSAMCLRKFARTARPVRRRIYQACGWTIVAMTVAVIVASWFKIMGPDGPRQVVETTMMVLWFEAIAIWAFALAWLVKGRVEERGTRRRARLRTRAPKAGQ
jgi:NADH:ubiquinone oxidoreductase subunit 6 (subunit J)